MRRFALIVTLVGLGIGIGGCGGGGGSYGGPLVVGTNLSGPSQPSKPPSKGFGTVVVTVKDLVGMPAGGAQVWLGSEYWEASATGVSDDSGTTTFKNVPAGGIWASASQERASGSQSGGTDQITLAPNGRAELAVALRVWPRVIGVGPAVVTSVAADGRWLEFSLRLIYDYGYPLARAGDGGDHPDVSYYMGLYPCNPDGVPHEADCIQDAGVFDAPYVGGDMVDALPVTAIPESIPPSVSAALLLDQSSRMSTNDPEDARLEATKIFLVSKLATDRVALAAFASNDSASGALSPLPNQPVTLFPVENPEFGASGNTLFPTIDSLGLLEGGASPLYAAIDAALDFTATHASANGRRAVVVLTAGLDDTCGSPTACRAVLQALIAKSRTTGIAIISIGLADGSGEPNPRALSELANAGGGATFWALEPSELGTLFAGLSKVLAGTAETLEAHFRIESPSAGAFQSGRTVFGQVHVTDCADGLLGCWDTRTMPFAVQIP
jgi:hypothetical protein